MKCTAGTCGYNNRQSCCCPTVKMSADGGGAKCISYAPLPHYHRKLSDGEFATDTDNTTCCSAENCVFNIHFSCKAKSVSVDGQTKACKSFYGI